MQFSYHYVTSLNGEIGLRFILVRTPGSTLHETYHTQSWNCEAGWPVSSLAALYPWLNLCTHLLPSWLVEGLFCVVWHFRRNLFHYLKEWNLIILMSLPPRPLPILAFRWKDLFSYNPRALKSRQRRMAALFQYFKSNNQQCWLQHGAVKVFKPSGWLSGYSAWLKT